MGAVDLSKRAESGPTRSSMAITIGRGDRETGSSVAGELT
jgi:hypothetical protein